MKAKRTFIFAQRNRIFEWNRKDRTRDCDTLVSQAEIQWQCNDNIEEKCGAEPKKIIIHIFRKSHAIGGIIAFVSTKSSTKCDTHVRKTVTGERLCRPDISANVQMIVRKTTVVYRNCDFALAKRPLRSAICFTVARIDIARDGNDRSVQPMGAITRVDCSPLKGSRSLPVFRSGKKKMRRVRVMRADRVTERFHYAGGISLRCFVRVSVVWHIDEYSSFMI